LTDLFGDALQSTGTEKTRLPRLK